jgi:hypothetical protein
MRQRQRRVPLLLLPVWLLWRLVTIISGLPARLIVVVLGLVLMISGMVLTITILGALVGISLFIFGGTLVLRGIVYTGGRRTSDGAGPKTTSQTPNAKRQTPNTNHQSPFEILGSLMDSLTQTGR